MARSERKTGLVLKPVKRGPGQSAEESQVHCHRNTRSGPFPNWMLSTGVGFGGKTDDVDWDVIGKNNPSGRVGTPEDIAGLAIFLCSRAGQYVVGQTIACDGGVVGTS